MRFVIALTALASLCACGGLDVATTPFTPAAPAPTPTPITQVNAPNSADNAAFGTLLNAVRSTNGAAAATFDARLAAAAQSHADDMAANNFFDHTGSNGSSVGDRARAAGYNWNKIGENIALGQQSEAEAMDSWTNSPGHHANNIDPEFEDFGLAKAGTGSDTNWVLVLGRD